MHLSDEPSERDSGTTVRMLFEILSALFSSVFQGGSWSCPECGG